MSDGHDFDCCFDCVNDIYVNDGHSFHNCFDCVNGISVNVCHDFAALTV